MTMALSRKWNGNSKSKLNQDDLSSLPHHELDQVTGGFTPRDPFEDRDLGKLPSLPDGLPSGRRF
jgi:hypothetical protein